MPVPLPSLTALYVALARGVATHESVLSRACTDPFAHQMLPGSLGMLVRLAAASQTAARALRYSSLGMFDHHAMRTALIDRMLHTAIDRGARQLALLGAGLDTRAHRLTVLSDVAVFEIDQARTQSYKRERAERLARHAREIHYASCDFQETMFEDVLRDARFAPEVPSCVIWEGVTMYLDEPAVERSLAALSRLCAPNSTLILTYAMRTESGAGAKSWAPLRALLAAIGEPIRFTCTTDEMEERLRKHGFRVLADVQPMSQTTGFGVQPLAMPLKNPLGRERLVVAERYADSRSRTKSKSATPSPIHDHVERADD
jgi:methyltransferase (TIGR00027 family)